MKSVAFVLAAAAAILSFHAQGEPLPENRIPDEIRPFIEAGTVAIALESADLNRDGRPDAVLVLETQPRKDQAPNGEEDESGLRSLRLLVRQPAGTLKLAKRNDHIVLCSSCGGVMGDPFQSVQAGPGTFSVHHYGGSGWRWSTTYRFDYSRRDDTWQLVRAEESSFHASNPNGTGKNTVHTPPRHFGKIDIADFDPEHYVNTGAR